MGSHYSTGSRHNALMVLRNKMGLASASPETRIKVRKNAAVGLFRVKNLLNGCYCCFSPSLDNWTQMPKKDTRIAAEHALLISEACPNRVMKVDTEIYHHKWALTKNKWDSHSQFEGILHITQLASTQGQYVREFIPSSLFFHDQVSDSQTSLCLRNPCDEV